MLNHRDGCFFLYAFCCLFYCAQCFASNAPKSFEAKTDSPSNKPSWHFYRDPQKPDRATTSKIKIAIIIDDLGNHKKNSFETATLPLAVTLAILPFTPYGQITARQGLAYDKEIMLHIPMEPLRDSTFDDGLMLTMSEDKLREKLTEMLGSIDGISGANNHMGSALTQVQESMEWVMEELASRQLFFIDSRTTKKTKALAQAQKHHIPSARRDVFLDNSQAPEDIAKQFDKLVNKAKSQGYAIAIGHPYPETLQFLKAVSSRLKNEDIEVVPVSEVLNEIAAAEIKTPAEHKTSKTKPSLAINGL